MLIKCKPVYNFQSVEFEIDVDIYSAKYDEQMAMLFSIYTDMLLGLKNVAIEQPALAKPVAVKKEQKEELASDSQKRYLEKLGIPFDDNITKKQAFKMIKDAQGDK